MLRLLCIAALAATCLAAIRDPKNAKECKKNYDEVVADFDATKAEKCDALVAFSKCVSAFPSNDDSEALLFEKQSKSCEDAFAKTGAPEVRTRRGNLQMTVDDARDVQFFRHRRETINVFTMHEKLGQLEAKLSTVTSELATTQDALKEAEKALNTKAAQEDLTKVRDTVDQKVAGDIKKLQEDTAKQITAANKKADGVQDDLDELSTKVGQDLAKAKQEREDAIKKLQAGVESSNKKVVEDVGKQVGAVKSSVVDKPMYFWSGGARAHRRGSGWHTMLMDRIEFDNSGPYFQRISNTKFKVLRDGMFSVDVDYIAHANSRCWSHFQFTLAGQNMNGANHVYQESWRTMQYHLFWEMKKGQEFWFRAYIANCGNPYVWHEASSWKGAYNRIQIEYKGVRAKDDKIKCTSQFGLC